MENIQEIQKPSSKRRLIVLLGSLGVVIIFVLLFIFVFIKPQTVEFANLKTAGNIDPIAIKDGKIEKPNDPKVLGWDFVGWCTDKSLEVLIDLDEYVFNDSTTLYAKWQLHRYVINYNLDGGKITSEGSPNSPFEYYCSHCHQICESSSKCEPCDQLIENEELESYEIYKQYSYVVKHEDLSDHTWKFDFDYSTKVPQPIMNNALNGVELAKPIKEGYTFEGWFTSPDFNADSRFDDTTLQKYIKMNETPVDITLYAMWAEI